MKKFILVVLFSAAFVSSITAADSINVIENINPWSDCTDALKTKNEQDICFKIKINDANIKLDDALRLLNKNYPDIAKVEMEAQKYWLKYRKIHCNATGLFYEGGSYQDMNVNACIIDETLLREQDIKKIYDLNETAT